MKSFIMKGGAIAIAIGIIGLFMGAHQGADADGKAMFTAAKCVTCHSVTAQGIEKTNKNSKAPDLSGTGLKHNAAFLAKYLKKEEAIGGKQHAMKYNGADVNDLSNWLAQQKKK